MNSEPVIAIAGATGAVGQEMLEVLQNRDFPVKDIKLLASARSKGKKLNFKGNEIEVGELKEGAFEGVDIALFSAGGGTSKAFAADATKSGAVVIDNSSAFRMDEDVPLVIPEINSEDLKNHKGIIANPNCSTIVTLMALAPLHRAFGLKRLVASTYQAVSGTGAMAIKELEDQVQQLTTGHEVKPEVYPHQIAFNLLPHVDAFLDSGYTKEEMKMENEGRKILHHSKLKISCTCVRVPVYRAHSISVAAEFENPVSVKGAQEAISAAEGVQMKDDPAGNIYPMPLDIAGEYDCFVGRLRKDCAFENGLSFWVVGDQLLKGAALNAVQIAEKLVEIT